MDFSGKVAIVTGGAQGIGEAYVRLLAKRSAAVVVADIKRDRGEALAIELSEAGLFALFMKTDVSLPESCRECVDAAVDAYGGVDYVVNNAGLLSAYNWPPLDQLSPEQYASVFAVNTHGVFNMTHAALPAMAGRSSCAVVNTSSVASWMADGAYALSKLGVNGLTVAFARALAGRNIRVNAVAPGPVETAGLADLGFDVEGLRAWARDNGKPTDGVAQPIEVAEVGIFLLSDAAKAVNGQIVAVDGATIVRQ
jgi:3-oxoacyl-[acyl-carrier protein] reductase